MLMLDITIVMSTWFTNEHRIMIAEDALLSWWNYLIYDGDIHLHIADDGSTLEWEPEKYWGGKITYSYQERKGVGASLNAGFKRAFETSPLVAYFVDDWILQQPFNLTPWAQMLDREDIGIVRLGPPHPFLSGKIEALTTNWQGWGLVLNRRGLVVSQRPSLWHKRMLDNYGWFQENTSAIGCEREYNERFVSQSGPDVVLALPHAWVHVGTESLSEVIPNA